MKNVSIFFMANFLIINVLLLNTYMYCYFSMFCIFMLDFLYVLLLKDVKFILVHIFIALYKCHILLTMFQITTAHLWCDGHSTSISACGVCEARVTVQVFRRELHIHIYLDYTRIEFYLVSKKKKKLCFKLKFTNLKVYKLSKASTPIRKNE